MNSPTKIVAGVLGLTAFVVAAIAGLGAGNAAETTLIRAVASMFVCYFAGLPLGMICEHVIEEHVREYAATRPVTGSDPAVAPVRAAGAAAAVDEEVIIV